MSIKNNLISDLFTLDCPVISPIFDKLTYPFEVLDKIYNYITDNRELWLNNGFSEVEKGVFIHKDARVSKLAIINAPCLICSKATVLEFAKLKTAVILGEDSQVGTFTEVKNSIFMQGAKAPHLNYVGDSVLGKFAHIGAGVKCSNLKSDGKNVKCFGIDTNRRKIGSFLGDYVEVGCNSVLAPGAVVGKESVIYPLSLIRGYLPSKSIYKEKGVICPKY